MKRGNSNRESGRITQRARQDSSCDETSLNNAAKILTREELRARAADWKRAGERITLANGCFDLLHVGHVRYLQAAKELGGKLVVAVNSDFICANTQRRIASDHARARARRNPAALASVDAVVIFSEPDVRALIREIQPDIQAKGTDYTTDSVPERDVVTSYGGRVAIVGDPKDHSATEIIRSHLTPRKS